MRRIIGAVLAALCIATSVSACGSGPVNYVPVAAAWGAGGQCYMPLGVPQSAWQAIEQQYIASHYCQAGWTPVYMPVGIYQRYYPYWSSNAYYGHYLPVSYRTVYVSYERSYGTRYHSQILTAERTATYKGSNGKVTTYNKISSGGGTRARFGTGGTRCDVMRSALLKPEFQAPDRGGVSGGGSHGGSVSGGGSRTSGRTSSGSHSGSHSGGC